MAKKIQDNIGDYLEYCPVSGNLIWKCNRGTRVKAGDLVKTISKKGYLTFNINSRSYLAHRVVWFLFYKEQPPEELDHKDQNKINNKISNLRVASKSENMCNRSFKNLSSKFKGVSRNNGRGRPWRAQINKHGVKYYLGLFNTEIEAALAYDEAAKVLQKDFAALNFEVSYGT